MGTLGIESAIVITMQQSLTKMKTIAACEQAVQCLREVTCEWQAKQDTVTRSGIDDESSSFPLPLMALLLAHAFVCHLKWRGCSQSITFLGNFLHEYFQDIYIITINPQNNISPVLENNIKYNISSLIFFNHSFHCFLFLQILRNIRTSAYIWICCKQAIKCKHYWSWSTSQETSLVCCSQNKWKLL